MSANIIHLRPLADRLASAYEAERRAQDAVDRIQSVSVGATTILYAVGLRACQSITDLTGQPLTADEIALCDAQGLREDIARAVARYLSPLIEDANAAYLTARETVMDAEEAADRQGGQSTIFQGDAA